MDKYLTTLDIPMLREHGFKSSDSGASWFGVAKDGEQWQAYVVDGDSRITFVGTNDRTSVFMDYETFYDKFNHA